jgi:actin-related protein
MLKSINIFWVCRRMVELMFEKYDVPALFLAKNAVCISVLIFFFKVSIYLHSYHYILCCVFISIMVDSQNAPQA